MALSPTNAWYESVGRADAEIRLLVTIYDGTNTFKAVDGRMDPTSDLATSNVPVAILGMTQLGVKLDPLTRQSEVNAIELKVHDGWIRPIAVAYQLAFQKISIHIGASTLNESDFLSAYVGEIKHVLPEADEQVSSIFTTDLIASLKRRMITGIWFDKHPAEVLYDYSGVHHYKGILDYAGLSGQVDADTFDRTGTQWADIENAIIAQSVSKYSNYDLDPDDFHGHDTIASTHWADDRGYPEIVNRKEVDLTKATTKPTSAFTLAQQVCLIVGAHLDFDESGKIRVVRFNADASALDTWNEGSDIFPGTFRQLTSGLDNIVNRVVWNFGSPKVTYIADDTDSQSAYAYPGTTERIESYEINTGWLNDWTNLADVIDATDTDIPLARGGIISVSGNRSDMTVDSDSPIYLFMREVFADEYDGDVTSQDEVIKCTSLTRFTSDFATVQVFNPTNLSGSGSWETFNVDSIYCQGGGTTRNWPDGGSGKVHLGYARTIVYDATLPVITSDKILKRFKNGAPAVECDTGIVKFPYQIGDFIYPVSDSYIAYGSDGLDGTKKFEIVGKEVSSDLLSIHWTLVAVNDDSLTRGVGLYANFGDRAMTLQHAMDSAVTRVYRRYGLGLTKDSGFDATLAAGKATNGTFTAVVPQSESYTFAASKDTYVTIDVMSSMVMCTPVPNDDPAPDRSVIELLLGVVVTNGSEITSIDVTGVTLQPIAGSDLEAGSGPLAQVNSSGQYDFSGTHQNTLTGNWLAAGAGPLAQLNSSGHYDFSGTHQSTLNAGAYVTQSSIATLNWSRAVAIGGRALNANRFGFAKTRG